jgi:hypothetical protein
MKECRDKVWIHRRTGFRGRDSFAVNVMTVQAWLARSLRLILYCFTGAQDSISLLTFPGGQNQVQGKSTDHLMEVTPSATLANLLLPVVPPLDHRFNRASLYAKNLCPAGDAVEDARVVDRDVLFGDDLDHFLRYHASRQS